MKKTIKLFIPPIVINIITKLRDNKIFAEFKQLTQKNIKLHNKHLGERCFILGSGPSIKSQDLTLLKNENFIALNNFYVHNSFQEMTSGIGSKYYLTAPTHQPQTRQEWVNWLSDMSNNMPTKVQMLFGINNYPDNIHNIVSEAQLFTSNELYWYYPQSYTSDKLSLDLVSPITSAGTASIYALIFALYMGFKEIYLVGCDHNYICLKNEKDYRFYEKALHQNNEEARINELVSSSTNTREFASQSQIFNLYNKLHKSTITNIYNLSSISLLDIFPNREFDTILKKNFSGSYYD
ncbi:MAG TPA: hypothetical protein PLP75_12400 [Burkholderiales bacterium]|jgi:hypothetical protein|nr:hypothetical protein [Burkholderiales bacterium]